MRWQTVLGLAQVLMLAACASASNSGNPGAPSAKLNQSFGLKVGASTSVDGEGILIGFDAVISDSRCPRGAQCIVAGDATIRVWLGQSVQTRETRDLKTTPADAAQAVINQYRVTLNSLVPEPTTNGSPRTSDYIATLVVVRLP